MSKPKLLVVNYFDTLIRNVDIHTEEQLEKYSPNDTFSPNDAQETFSEINSKLNNYRYETSINESISDPYSDEYDFDTQSSSFLESKEIKIIDYLNSLREEQINEIECIQTKLMKHCEANRETNKKITEQEDLERKLFANKFAFILEVNEMRKGYRRIENKSPSKIYLIILDFYLDHAMQQLLW